MLLVTSFEILFIDRSKASLTEYPIINLTQKIKMIVLEKIIRKMKISR